MSLLMAFNLVLIAEIMQQYILLTYESNNDDRLVDNHILEAIVNMKEQKGSDKAAIASYIEVFQFNFTNDSKI